MLGILCGVESKQVYLNMIIVLKKAYPSFARLFHFKSSVFYSHCHWAQNMLMVQDKWESGDRVGKFVLYEVSGEGQCGVCFPKAFTAPLPTNMLGKCQKFTIFTFLEILELPIFLDRILQCFFWHFPKVWSLSNFQSSRDFPCKVSIIFTKYLKCGF